MFGINEMRSDTPLNLTQLIPSVNLLRGTFISIIDEEHCNQPVEFATKVVVVLCRMELFLSE